MTTAYRSGPIIDLCMGPHVPDSGRVKAFEVLRASSAYWLGKAENDALQRVYGVAFPDKKEMTKWKKFQQEAAKRDHRKVGAAQKLFFFDALSPGSAFMAAPEESLVVRLASPTTSPTSTGWDTPRCSS